MTRAPVHDLLLAATEAEGKVMTGAWHLAQFNVAKLVAPKGDLRVQPFFDAIERVNALAEASPGFVWRLQDEGGDATEIDPVGDPLLIVNLSVWTDADSLFGYVYKSAHTPVMARRREFFERFGSAHQALWWVPAGHRPSVDEGSPGSGSSTATAPPRAPSPSRRVSRRRARRAKRPTCTRSHGARGRRDVSV